MQQGCDTFAIRRLLKALAHLYLLLAYVGYIQACDIQACKSVHKQWDTLLDHTKLPYSRWFVSVFDMTIAVSPLHIGEQQAQALHVERAPCYRARSAGVHNFWRHASQHCASMRPMKSNVSAQPTVTLHGY